MRFAVDHMVIRLGKYLRIAGYDAIWDAGVRTHDLILRANAEQRVFVTRNRQIAFQYPAPAQQVTLATSDPVAQFEQVVTGLGLDPQPALFSRCIRCNVALETILDRESVRARVHPNVFERHQPFYRCPACATVFWHGSHVTNTCRKLHLAPPSAEPQDDLHQEFGLP